MDSIHAAVPYSLLVAVRQVDRQSDDVEGNEELSAKKLGASRTVDDQIGRYSRTLASGRKVPAEEVEGLFKLVSRRLDSDLVVKIAGQQAAAGEISRTGKKPGVAAVSRRISRKSRIAAARKILRSLLDADLTADDGDFVVVAGQERVAGDLQVLRCAYDGAVIAEILHVLAEFEGALEHHHCVAHGSQQCAWRALGPAG